MGSVQPVALPRNVTLETQTIVALWLENFPSLTVLFNVYTVIVFRSFRWSNFIIRLIKKSVISAVILVRAFSLIQPTSMLMSIKLSVVNKITKRTNYTKMMVYCSVPFIMGNPVNWKNFDPTEPIRGLINSLKFVGVWPLDIKNRFLYFLYILYGILFQFTFSYAYTAFGTTIDATNVKMMTEQIFVGLAEISLCLRMTNFLYHFKEATTFLTTIKSFKLCNEEEHELYKKKLSLFSTVMTFFVTVTLFAVMFSNAAPLFNSEVRLPYPGWYPLDWGNLWVKCMVFWY